MVGLPRVKPFKIRRGIESRGGMAAAFGGHVD